MTPGVVAHDVHLDVHLDALLELCTFFVIFQKFVYSIGRKFFVSPEVSSDGRLFLACHRQCGTAHDADFVAHPSMQAFRLQAIVNNGRHGTDIYSIHTFRNHVPDMRFSRRARRDQPS